MFICEDNFHILYIDMKGFIILFSITTFLKTDDGSDDDRKEEKEDEMDESGVDLDWSVGDTVS